MNIYKYNFRMLLICGFLCILVQNCTFKNEIDKDPNNPISAPINSLLAPAQMLIAYTWGGNLSRYNGMFNQQLEGYDAQSLGLYNYQFLRSDTDDPWDNLYRVILSSKELLNVSKDVSPHYSGVSKVVIAYTLGTLTSLYGDIPYTEAGLAESGVNQPKFQSQQEIYSIIQTLLNEAVFELNQPTSVNSPGVDDIIYGGDLKSWEYLAYALKARYFLHTAKVDPMGYTKVLETINSSGLLSTASGFTDFKLKFTGASATSQAPWFQFNDQRATIIPNAVLRDTMLHYSDSRLKIYMDISDTVVNAPGDTSFNVINWFGSYLMAASDHVTMIGLTELYFIQSEALFQTGDMAGAADALNTAISLSFGETGGDISTFTGNFNATNITLNTIMTQKWVALWLNPESFIDWRRTGFPEIAPVDGSAIPRKYPYSQKELNYNAKNIPIENSTPYLTRMWIDP